MSHQLRIQAPYFQDFIQRINFKHIKKFDACWVPDDERHTLSGKNLLLELLLLFPDH